MKNFFVALSCFVIALAGSQVARANTSVVLSPDRASHTGTLLNNGTVLIAGGVNENGDLNSALIYDEGANTLTPTGDLTVAREFHAAVKLADGRVFISGGSLLDGTTLKSCEIYDPSTGVFTQLSHAMKIPRKNHTATLLNDGTVLLVGGKNAEIFDPGTETFTTLVSVPLNRSGHTATMLQDGTVLIAGGYVGGLSNETAEIYDPTTQLFNPANGTMVIPRSNHAATLLLDGRVLISGGFTGTSPQLECDLYDPVSKTFTETSDLTYHRSNHVGILLPNGQVLVVGGTTLESGFLAINEVYDPATAIWTTQPPMNENRSGATANLMPDANIFVAGGITGSLTLQTAEILDPATMNFTPLPNLNVPRNQHTDTLLPDGRVLLAGGSTDAVYLESSEIFDPITNTFTPSDNLRLARKSHTATLLADNANILIAGGKTPNSDTEHCELYNIASGTFSQSADMITSRSLHTATLLPNGLVLEAAGRHGGSPTKHAELYDPNTGLFTATGDLNLQRKRFRANLLQDGTVFLSGGATLSQDQQTDSGTPTCEIYDPALGTFTYTIEEMHFGRTEHESTLLPDGHVIVTGGILTPNQADLYDPATQTFTLEGSFLEQRLRHVAILLNNPVWGALTDKVILIGGADIGNSAFGGLEQALASCEIYDPATGQFSFFGNMTEPRQNHTATMLNDGRIMIAGGVSSPAFSGTGELIVTGIAPTPTPSPTPTPTPSPTPTPTPSPSPSASPSPSPSPTASPTPTPSPSPSPSASPTPTPGPTPVELGNISTRMSVGTGDNVMIGGFIVTGSVPKKVIVRAIGTSLLPSFPDALRDPYLEVHDKAGAIIAANDDWQDGDKIAILESGVAPTEKKESAVVLTLNPGNYTAIVSGVGGTTGIGLVEVYDLSATDPSKLANISTRGLVQTGDDVMILGTIILGDAPAKVLFRAIGPSLPVNGAMADPTLELHDQDGNLIVSNDNWRSDQEAEIIASTIPPTSELESAIVATLNPGEYTAIVRGANNTTGVALAEAYQLPNE